MKEVLLICVVVALAAIAVKTLDFVTGVEFYGMLDCCELTNDLRRAFPGLGL